MVLSCRVFRTYGSGSPPVAGKRSRVLKEGAIDVDTGTSNEQLVMNGLLSLKVIVGERKKCLSRLDGYSAIANATFIHSEQVEVFNSISSYD